LNNDGAVKAIDSLIAQRAAIALVALDNSQKKLADVNNDGKITASDAFEILRYSINLSKNTIIGTMIDEYVLPVYE